MNLKCLSMWGPFSSFLTSTILPHIRSSRRKPASILLPIPMFICTWENLLPSFATRLPFPWSRTCVRVAVTFVCIGKSGALCFHIIALKGEGLREGHLRKFQEYDTLVVRKQVSHQECMGIASTRWRRPCRHGSSIWPCFPTCWLPKQTVGALILMPIHRPSVSHNKQLHQLNDQQLLKCH